MQSNEIQQKRLNKEISILKGLSHDYKITRKETVDGMQFQVEIPKRLISSEHLHVSISKLNFVIYVDARFPFQAPRVITRTKFSFPSLADGRDLLADIVKKPWTPSLTLAEIIQLIPNFISEVFMSIQREENQFFGIFHLGVKYDVHEWSELPSCGFYECQEVSDESDNELLPRFIVITESALLLFEPDKKNNAKCTLISWATLQSLDKIKRNLDQPNIVTLSWRQITDSENPWELRVWFVNPEECISQVVENMKKLGVGVEKKNVNMTRIPESEVTVKTLKNVKIDDIIDTITVYEMALMDKLNIDIVQSLMNLYQKAVEYYSALDNPNFEQYMDKLHRLLKRQDVMALVTSQNEIEEAKSTHEEEEKLTLHDIEHKDKNRKSNEILKAEDDDYEGEFEKKSTNAKANQKESPSSILNKMPEPVKDELEYNKETENKIVNETRNNGVDNNQIVLLNSKLPEALSFEEKKIEHKEPNNETLEEHQSSLSPKDLAESHESNSDNQAKDTTTTESESLESEAVTASSDL